jgi:hypothetical protein
MNKRFTGAGGAGSGVFVPATALDHRQQAPRPHAVRRLERSNFLQRGTGFIGAAEAGEDIADSGEDEQEQVGLGFQRGESGVGGLHVAPVGRQ